MNAKLKQCLVVTYNGNYDEGAATALDPTSLATGLARMMAQRDEENRDLDIRARTLLVLPELQQTAKELLQSDFIQRANNDLPTGNTLKNSVQLEVEPRLSNSDRFSGTSTKAWYLFASLPWTSSALGDSPTSHVLFG